MTEPFVSLDERLAEHFYRAASKWARGDGEPVEALVFDRFVCAAQDWNSLAGAGPHDLKVPSPEPVEFDPEDIPVANTYSREDFGPAEAWGWNACREYVIDMLAKGGTP